MEEHSIALFVPAVCFAELVQTGLWVVWAEQHALYTRFPPRIARMSITVYSIYCDIEVKLKLLNMALQAAKMRFIGLCL